MEKAVTTYKIPSNKKILGFIGRLDEQKGIILATDVNKDDPIIEYSMK